MLTAFDSPGRLGPAAAGTIAQCISPLLITLRVLSRRAWTRTSKTRLQESMATITYVGHTHISSIDCGTPSYPSDMRTASGVALKSLTDPV